MNEWIKDYSEEEGDGQGKVWGHPSPLPPASPPGPGRRGMTIGKGLWFNSLHACRECLLACLLPCAQERGQHCPLRGVPGGPGSLRPEKALPRALGREPRG